METSRYGTKISAYIEWNVVMYTVGILSETYYIYGVVGLLSSLNSSPNFSTHPHVVADLFTCIAWKKEQRKYNVLILFHRKGKYIRAWYNMRVNKRWHIFHFWINNSFKYIYSVFQTIIFSSHESILHKSGWTT